MKYKKKPNLISRIAFFALDQIQNKIKSIKNIILSELWNILSSSSNMEHQWNQNIQQHYITSTTIEKILLLANIQFLSFDWTLGGITELFRPGFSKTLVLVSNQVLKIQNWVKPNRTLITQNPVSIIQNYPKTKFLF